MTTRVLSRAATIVAAWVAAAGGAEPAASPAALGLDPATLGRIGTEVEAAIAAGDCAGAVVCVGRRDGVALAGAWGRRVVEPVEEAMTVDTVFDLASLTKPVATATLAMRLVEEGKLRLSDSVAAHLPGFEAEGKGKITVRDLLLHSSGMIADNALADYEQGPDEAWRRILALAPIAPPGERFVYSDVNFLLLGRIVEALGGAPLDRAFAERVAAPLGLTETGFLPPAPLRPRIAPTERRGDLFLRGEVHDPRAAKLGGVAGHAGLFGTATDLAAYARALLGGGSLGGARILSPQTAATMTRAWRVPGGGLRGLGWDAQSALSGNRGDLLSQRAFGHGGFTGTALWIDPGLDLFVVFLSSRLHPHGKGVVNPLAARVGSIAAAAVRTPGAAVPRAGVACGVDVLESGGFRELAGRRVGLITNHTGRSRGGVPTATLLAGAPGVELVALFSPEHGFAGALDQAEVPDARDPDTGLPVRSLYGRTRRPTAAMLADVDTLVFDIQDVGCRFYTYVSTMGEAMRAAAEHGKRFVVLDRPNPLGGVEFAGPVLDPGAESFVAWHPLALRHGMTVGELARMFAGELALDLDLVVVPCAGWRRADAWDATGLEWVNPSPNMRSLAEAFLYPGVGLLEMTNVSVGRGTDTPFEVVGAPWIDGRLLADELAGRAIPGVAIVPVSFTPDASRFAGERCGGVNLAVTDRAAFDPVRLGIELAAALRALHPREWQAEKWGTLLGDRELLDALLAGRPADELHLLAARRLRGFAERRGRWLLYD